MLAGAHKCIDALPETKSWVIEVRPFVKKRTLDQNAAMFGLAYKIIMEATGLEGERDRQKLHETFCGDFFGWKDIPILGRKPRRTTTTDEDGNNNTIDTATMAKLYDHIQRTAAEYGIFVPDPDPLHNHHR